VNDVFNVGDVQTSGCDVCGDENSAIVFRKSFQILQSLLLVHLRVQPQSLAFQEAEQVDQSEK
jgi:hypothetical protein